MNPHSCTVCESQLGASKYEFCPRAANIQLNFTSLSDSALNMEHSVCKVSLAHHTKEWLSALFEALDGFELSVNNYLFTLLWIAFRNECLSHHLYHCLLQVPSNNLLCCTELRNWKWWCSMWSHGDAFLSRFFLKLSVLWIWECVTCQFSLLDFWAEFS